MFDNKLLIVLLFAICGGGNRPPQPIPKYHTVRPGESLWIIAQKYGINLSDLIAANPQIQNPDLIFPDQVVVIPR